MAKRKSDLTPLPRTLTRQARLMRNRIFAGVADFLRNLGLLFIAAPLVEPLAGLGPSVAGWRLATAIGIGLALVAGSLIFDAARRE